MLDCNGEVKVKSGELKKIFLLILVLPLFAFEVEFTKIFKKTFYPKKNGYLIKTNFNLIFPFKVYKIESGYIVPFSYETYLNNDFYPPKDAKFEEVKYSVIDFDRIQLNLIKNLKTKYKNCKIKKISFLTPDITKIITKPTTIELKYRIKMECK